MNYCYAENHIYVYVCTMLLLQTLLKFWSLMSPVGISGLELHIYIVQLHIMKWVSMNLRYMIVNI